MPADACTGHCQHNKVTIPTNSKAYARIASKQKNKIRFARHRPGLPVEPGLGEHLPLAVHLAVPPSKAHFIASSALCESTKLRGSCTTLLTTPRRSRLFLMQQKDKKVPWNLPEQTNASVQPLHPLHSDTIAKISINTTQQPCSRRQAWQVRGTDKLTVGHTTPDCWSS